MDKYQNIGISCPSCKQSFVFRVSGKMAGTKQSCKCPNCNTKLSLTIPAAKSFMEIDSTLVDEALSSTSISLQLSLICDNALSAKYQSFNLKSERSVIGRKPTESSKVADIEVETNDKTMSREHAIIRKVKNIGFTIKNPGKPTNGIVINDQPKLDQDTEIYLNDGDVLCLGNTKFLVNIIRDTLNKEDVSIA